MSAREAERPRQEWAHREISGSYREAFVVNSNLSGIIFLFITEDQI